MFETSVSVKRQFCEIPDLGFLNQVGVARSENFPNQRFWLTLTLAPAFLDPLFQKVEAP